jgi:serine/threonine protein phosphatase PrpC
MTQITIICVALAVLALAILMIVRELRRSPIGTPAAHGIPVKAKAERSERPVSAARIPSTPPPRMAGAEDEEVEVDLTKFGERPAKAKGAALPRLGADSETDVEESSGDSTALTFFEEGAEVDEPTGPIDLILLSAAAQSDVGQKRKRNEDAFLLDDEKALFVVADGMGGYAGGDIASHLATDTIASTLSSGTLPITGSARRPRIANQLVAAIEAANAAIYAEAQKNPDLHGMGTTVVAASFPRKKRRGYIAYAGDSRCYRLRNSELKLLTIDHTFANKGIGGPIGNQIRRAVGVRPTIKVDLIVDTPKSGDVYLLCSDGLNKMLGDDELQALVLEHREDLTACARRLVRRANEAGGRDNVTVVVVGVRESVDAATNLKTGARSLTS